MGFCIQLLAYFFISAGVYCTNQISSLRCNFNDEEVSFKEEIIGGTPRNKWDTKFFSRNALLQFGIKGGAPVHPDTITFLITPSKLDIRKFLEDVDVDQLACELQRYSTEGIHVRWPVKGEHEYNRWFTCRIKDSKGHFETLIFIRQSTEQPPSGQHDYRNWTVIEDNAVLIMSVVMVMKTQTPTVTATLRSEQKLHCQFYTDHNAAKVTVEWHKYGCKYESKYKCKNKSKYKCTNECNYECKAKENTTLFRLNRQSGASQGSGVALKRLATGDATYTIPSTNMSSEGIYMCSVHLYPLLGTLTTTLQIEEQPQVSLNVDPSLSLTVGAEKTVLCEADGYYHVNPTIHWSHQGVHDVGPVVQDIPLHTSHKRKCDGTLSFKAFFYLKAKLSDSGRQFTCTVSHQSMREPIRKSFTLTVEEPGQWILVFSIFLLVGVFFFTWNYLHKERRKTRISKNV